MSQWWIIWEDAGSEWRFATWIWGTRNEMLQFASHLQACDRAVRRATPMYLISDQNNQLVGPTGTHW